MMNKLVVYSFVLLGMVVNGESYDAIQSPLFEKYNNWVKEFNIPLAQDLDSADANKIEIFDIIKNEINGIKLYMSEQNGR